MRFIISRIFRNGYAILSEHDRRTLAENAIHSEVRSLRGDYRIVSRDRQNGVERTVELSRHFSPLVTERYF